MMSLLQSRGGMVAGWLVAAGLLLGFVFFQVVPLVASHGTGIPGIASGQNDYKHVWAGARLLQSGFSPYPAEVMLSAAGGYAETEDHRFRTINPYVYPPFTALVMMPLAQLPFASSAVAFSILNHILLLGALFLAAWLLGWRGNPWVVVLLLAMVSFNATVFRQNNAGQLNVILLFGYTLVLVGIRRSWPTPVLGAIAAALALFKLSPGILLIWFLLRREWKRAGWMAAFTILFTLVTLVLFGWGVHWDFLPVLRDMGYGSSTWQEYGNTFWRDPYNMSFNALFHRLFVEHEGSGMVPWVALSPVVANGFTWLVSLMLLGLFAFVSWNQKIALSVSYSTMILVSLLLPALFWDHYLVQALLPVMLLSFVAFRLPGITHRWVLLGLIALSVVVLSWTVRFHGMDWNSGPALLLHNLKLLPALMLLGVAGWMVFSGEPKPGAGPDQSKLTQETPISGNEPGV
ncbi:MAG: DUF2029 domain-containing protein [Candidatus Sumerlaeia bacterium]|nr:DUF2029 domain-containing protein [Candidatus Sumerlaeia bacterium]